MTSRVEAEKSVHINKKTPKRERFCLLAVRQGFATLNASPLRSRSAYGLHRRPKVRLSSLSNPSFPGFNSLPFI